MMKYLLTTLLALLLIGTTQAHHGEYVNEAMLQDYREKSNKVNTDIDYTVNKIPEVQNQQIKVWRDYLDCKESGSECIHSTREIAVGVDQELDRLNGVLTSLYGKQVDSWRKYNECKLSREGCDKKPVVAKSVGTSGRGIKSNGCKADLVYYPQRNHLSTYAYQYSGCDKDFVLMITNENASWSSGTTNRNTNGTSDHGICQINSYYHPHITNDSRFRTDPYWVIQQCHKLYKGGTRFYGRDNRARRIPEVRFY